METSIVKSNGNIIHTMDDAERAARAMSASGFFADTKQASQAIVKILAGQELGFGPFASMTGVHIIQNKPVLAANLMAAAVKRTGKYNYRVTTQTEKECVITWFENGQEVGKSSFTIQEAERAGLTRKDNWKNYPSDMLFARAISRGQKRYAPDIFNGATVYTPDEMGATVDEEGNVIEATQVQPLEQTPVTIDPEEIYNEACQRVVKSNGREIAIGDMTKEQLDWLIANGKDQKNIDAALIVLQHDFSMTTEAESQPA